MESTLPEIVALRHELHQHPEVRFEETWTSDRIAAFLNDIGVRYTRGHAGGTGIVAAIEGSAPGKTVALRADMDALEMEEGTGLPYASTIPGRMHACGHDGHTAILCGAAKILAGQRDALHGTVRLLFQPAEEQGCGARFMVDEGAVDGVDAIFGLHGWPTLPLGHVAVKPGPFMASADFFRVVVQGKGCHGAQPAAGVDPVVVAAHITTALQTIVSREINPCKPGIVTVAHIEAGSTTNIIPDTALLEGTIRSFDTATDRTIREGVVRIAEHAARAFRASAEVTFGEGPYPPLVNDIEMTDFVAATARDTLGSESVTSLEQPVMVAEDFACYLERVPGSFFYLGVNPGPTGSYPALHRSDYNFPDEALLPGMQVMVALARRFLG